jgi:hypothetical protein
MILHILRENVQTLEKIFPPDTPDEKWIPEVARRGWVIVTADRNIKTTPHLRRILHESKVTAFFLSQPFSDQKLWDFAVSLLTVWPEIKKVAEKSKPGDSYLVYRSGKVEPFPEDTAPAKRTLKPSR